MNRIFIMSSERSGSNLLKNMLGAHDDIIAPTAIHFTTNMAKWSAFYQCEKGIQEELLIQDMMDLAKSHIAPWNYNIEVGQVVNKIKKHNFWGVFVSLYDTLTEKEGKTGWVCKDNALFSYASEIISQYPDAKFIYIVRDGRDVALSFLNVPGGPNTLSDAASLWTKEQQECLRISKIYPQNVFIVRYEDILRDTVSQIKSLCDFVGLSYSDRMVTSFFDNCDISGTSVFWKNLNKPLMLDNHSKWRNKMKSKDVSYYQCGVNGETKGMLNILGYDVLEKELSIFYLKIRRTIDYTLKVFYYLKNNLLSQEKHARLPKKQAINNIRNKLISNRL